ncbi:hypothetical protein Pst134EA_015362 [Puccinia striiformis f. sp. tritici]|uniref:hypothetical protein n=1 Tax=Puccinia striiformis f. sp. tritici TaxID=168172 RepID=UPI0020073C7C|nr:hypothetical protein Pst134EA_015362 [Puccinia striiformis f. sp. tritici]KAH9452524.1 hypothetical protein Pst134EB_016477 [Puccinia striiformis f. sp. tritici]KAH9463277.1 hypothetical protein Pst134EA_015362 [Puccinia striiformis f. sp. tritici]KAI9604665.1 hypothetical protein KEM48_002420 [Puccinia striiformis f. sp. tritici PST-130]
MISYNYYYLKNYKQDSPVANNVLSTHESSTRGQILADLGADVAPGLKILDGRKGKEVETSKPRNTDGDVESNEGTKVDKQSGANVKLDTEEWRQKQIKLMRDDFEFLWDSVTNFRDQRRRKASKITFSNKSRKLMEGIKELQSIHKLMLIAIQNRLVKLKGKCLTLSPLEPRHAKKSQWKASFRSRIQTARKVYTRKRENFLEKASFEKAVRFFPTYSKEKPAQETAGASLGKPTGEREGFRESSEVSDVASEGPLKAESLPIHLEAGKLRGDPLDLVIDMASWEWLQRLNSLLQKINTKKMWKSMTQKGKWDQDALDLQKLIFKTVDYMYTHELISLQNISRFFRLDESLDLAMFNMAQDLSFVTNLFRENYSSKTISKYWYSPSYVHLINDCIRAKYPEH